LAPFDYKDAAPDTALPEGLSGFKPLQLDQAPALQEVADWSNKTIWTGQRRLHSESVAFRCWE
jgi:hypothetical protein